MEMKKLLIIWALASVLGPISVSAQNYYDHHYIDFLESGNLGGWGTSLKTWDEEYSMNVGDTVEFDVWLNDVAVEIGLLEASFWATYDPSKLSIVDVKAYDGSVLPGPWDAEGTYILPDAGGPGTYMIDCIVTDYNVDCVQPDSDGDTIIARVKLRSEVCGDAQITFSDLPVL